MIICIHCPFLGVAGKYFTSLARIAVPVFFMITGYYHSETNRGKAIKQIKKIFILMVEANVLYFLWRIFICIISGNGLTKYFQQIFTIKSITEFILLNESPLGGHLWYLGAILYVLLIMFFVDYFNKQKAIFILTPFLLLIDLLFGKYSLLLLNQEYSYLLVRNFLFVGVPYFSIGMILRNINKKLSVKNLVFACCIFVLTTFAERYFLVSIGCNATRDHYVSTTFLAISVFLLMREYYLKRMPGKLEKITAYIGKNYSTWVYIVHPIMITVITVIARYLGVLEILDFVMPIVVYICSIVFVMIASLFISRVVYGKP